MKLSEQTSLYIAEQLLKLHSEKYYDNESQRRSESDVESVREDEPASSSADEKPDMRASAKNTMRRILKPVKFVDTGNGHDPTKSASFSRRKPFVANATNADSPKHQRAAKRVNDAVGYVSTARHSNP